MGRIRTKDIKDLARSLHEVYPDKCSPDFEENKKVMADLKIVEGKSKRFRNKVAGYIVRLVRQVEHGHRSSGERGPEIEQAEAEVAEEIAAEETEETEAQSEPEETKVSEEKSE